ncbi:hypothetical protein QFC19_006678 [Naganishia cerealis]|uniref:Uncharacterized protein n=1 Tax=Naganishia cerealis TaxID=610337 RepID=A0ACC2VEJ4_9TREE|nr:hypothetical protein QFC19_006678 [Naganishia cerealis]
MELKDSDVTWLYGPLHTAVEPVPPPKVATTDERLGIVRADSGTKPILKHRTLSEMLTIPMPSSPVLESTYMQDDEDIDNSGDVTPRPQLMQTKSDTNIVRRNNTRKSSPPRGPIGSGGRTPVEPATPGPTTPDGEALPTGSKRHISFNTFVEQCIAVDDPNEIPAIEAEAMDEEDDDDDDSDGMLEIRSASSSGRTSSSRGSRPTLSRHSSVSSSADHMTIAKIAPTTLKTLGGADGAPLVHAPPEAYAAEHGDDDRGVHYRHQPPAQTAPGYTSPGGNSNQWDEEDDYDVGVDYFSGPDLGVGDEYDTRRHMGSSSDTPRAVQANLGKHFQYGLDKTANNAPQVGNAPNSAKWRQSSSPSSSSGSSPGIAKSTLSPKTHHFDLPSSPMSPQPSRGILKVRAPNHTSSTAHIEDLSPTSSYFNFNPSPATGFGGFVQGVQRVIKETPTGSLPLYDAAGPLQSPPQGPQSVPTSPVIGTEPNERGRSVVRAPTVIDRSLSRGNTNSASVSPNAARLPVQIPGSLNSGNRPVLVDTNSSGGKTVFTPDLSTDGMTSPGFPISTAEYAAMDKLGRGIGARATGGSLDDRANEMEVDSSAETYVAEKSNTPTPHSSPQVRYPFGDTTNA